MKLPEDIHEEDLSQWLNNCWVRVPQGVARYDGTMGREHVSCWIPDEGEHLTVRVGEVDIEWPMLGYINIEYGALYVQRRTARQWRRAYCHRSVNVEVPASWELRERYQTSELWNVGSDDTILVKALFDPQWPCVRDALAMLKGGIPTVAINRHVCLLMLNDEVQVYYKLGRVGKIEGGEYVPDDDDRMSRRVRKLMGEVA